MQGEKMKDNSFHNGSNNTGGGGIRMRFQSLGSMIQQSVPIPHVFDHFKLQSEQMMQKDLQGGKRAGGECHSSITSATSRASSFSTTAAAAADEYWTDERRCYAKNQVPSGPRSKDDMGIPGFTPNERRRFENILSEANLVDIWRHLHPAGVASDILPYLGRHGGTAERNPWDRANYTWRGTTGRNQAVARYQGKGQRIDYFLISRSAVGDGDGDGGRVVSCDILGYGERREGYFCGSDHCPIVLVMKDDASAAAAAGGKGRCSSKGDNGDDDRKLPAKEKAAPAEKDIIDLT
mmetsp:Transcript_21237/g.47422  ORF Transcript_21237/g.47422 Transcript_21237/m.47422 type:complete len:293 (-) Transcript_21237:37-915(-)